MKNPENTELDIQCELAEELLVSFLREEVSQAGFSRVLLGLSGGIDSALSAALAVRAFGPENVLCVTLPYRSSARTSGEHAELCARRLKTALRRVDISALVDGYCEQERVSDPTRRGNVMARARMLVLYDLSVEWKGLVVGTSNKTEMLLGYTTQFGDSAHALNPLGDLYKHQVYQLARHLELPQEILDKPPSADLVAGQTDEGDLGFSYALADAILWRLVDRRQSIEELNKAGFPPDIVRKIAQRIVRNQYKRLPPVIAKLSERTIGHDFRYLRDWGI
jgi:NAD+ synthase